MKLNKLHHVSINVCNVEDAGRFYQEKLGFEKVYRPELGIPGMWLQIGDHQLHLIQVENHQAPKGQHFALQVDDIQSARSELMNRDVKVGKISQQPNGNQQCFFFDPSDNMIELNQLVS